VNNNPLTETVKIMSECFSSESLNDRYSLRSYKGVNVSSVFNNTLPNQKEHLC